jgi:hypothetical protein
MQVNNNNSTQQTNTKQQLTEASQQFIKISQQQYNRTAAPTAE